CGADTLPKEAIAPHLDGAWECGTCLTFEIVQSNLCAARTEAERRRQQYEALRAGVERVAQYLRDRAHATARDWRISGHSYHGGASDAYCEAEQMVRRVLDEA